MRIQFLIQFRREAHVIELRVCCLDCVTLNFSYQVKRGCNENESVSQIGIGFYKNGRSGLVVVVVIAADQRQIHKCTNRLLLHTSFIYSSDNFTLEWRVLVREKISLTGQQQSTSHLED